MTQDLLRELVIILAASVLIIYVSHKIRLPGVVGFLLTGILIGPGGFSLVRDSATIDVLAEIGVVMLLFMIGLEFTLGRLKRIQRNFWMGGGLQVLLTIAVGTLVLALLRVPFKQAIFYGCLISLSSTAVVLKILGDRKETDTPQGRIAFGILIFQDLAIVPMLAFVPLLANVKAVSAGAVALRFAVSMGTIAGVFLIARHLMPRVLHLVVGTRIREIFLIASLFICLGMAWLTSALGLSLALGAFLAGVIISESKFSHQVVSDILPFKDVFNSLFFISVGLLLNTGVVWRFRLTILVLVASILALKALVVVLTVGFLGYSSRIALIAGLALAQIGEFSFVLAGVGRASGLLTGDAFQVFLAASILTILATPFLIQVSPAVADRTEGAFGWKGWVPHVAESPQIQHAEHVIIAGYGLNGRNLAHVLREAGIPYLILELNPETVRKAAADGETVIFGDASSRTILKEAAVERAAGMVFAISDPAMTRRGVRAARELNKGLFVIVRTQYASEVDELYGLGADDVIPEEFETSIEIFTRVLDRFHVPRNIIDAQVKVLRGECYGVLRGTCEAVRPTAERVADLLAAGTTETFYVAKGAWLAGKTLGEIDLRNGTGATVIAVVRGEDSFAGPGADFAVDAGDTLVLVANHKDMNRAFDWLTRGPLEGAGGGEAS